MTDKQLRYLVTLAEDGNMTSVAQKLYVSQPSLSYLLAHVESELGVQIFDRDTQPMSLTYAGEKYIAAAKEMLDIQRNMENVIQTIKRGEVGRLYVGCGTQNAASLFPIILPLFIKRYPKVKLKLQEDGHDILCDKLRSGELDFIIVNRPVNQSGITSIELAVEEFFLFSPPDTQLPTHPEENKKMPVVNKDALRDLPYVLTARNRNTRRLVDGYFEMIGITPHVFFETGNADTCIALAESGVGYTLLPRLAYRMAHRNITTYSLPGELLQYYYISYKKSTYIAEYTQYFIELCKTVLQVE